jgi:hypothetical protein
MKKEATNFHKKTGSSYAKSRTESVGKLFRGKKNSKQENEDGN